MNKNAKYLLGHPVIHNQFDAETPEDWAKVVRDTFGLVKCRILSPYALFHPVLPVRVADKLLFPLCLQCAKEQLLLPWQQRTYHCDHTPRERVFVDTWWTPKLAMVLEHDYVILYI